MTFEQIGQKLKSARESQGLSLTQIWERTKIPLHHLQSMESGVTDELPETVYVAGFIKRYADVVGLNGQALSDEFRREAVPESPSNGNGHFARPRTSKGSAQSVVVVPAPYMGKTRIESGRPSLMKMMVFPALSCLMLISLIALLLKLHSDSASNQPDPSILNLGTRLQSVPATGPTVAPPTTAPTQTAPAAQPVNSTVELTASKHVWLDVKSIATGESLFTGFLEAGDRRDFKDAQGIRVHAGNGGSVTVATGGKSETLGANGKIAEKSYITKGAVAPTDTAGTTDATKTGASTTGTALTTPKPVVKKVARKPDAAKRKRSSDESTSRPSGDAGAGRSIDVPYRYTEGRLDTEQ